MNREELAAHIQESVAEALSKHVSAPLTDEQREIIVDEIRGFFAELRVNADPPRKLDRVDARTLRIVGFNIPDDVPDSSTVSTLAIVADSTEEQKAQGIIVFKIDPTAEWWPSWRTA